VAISKLVTAQETGRVGPIYAKSSDRGFEKLDDLLKVQAARIERIRAECAEIRKNVASS
jgi:hypothetical protein